MAGPESGQGSSTCPVGREKLYFKGTGRKGIKLLRGVGPMGPPDSPHTQHARRRLPLPRPHTHTHTHKHKHTHTLTHTNTNTHTHTHTLTHTLTHTHTHAHTNTHTHTHTHTRRPRRRSASALVPSHIKHRIDSGGIVAVFSSVALSIRGSAGIGREEGPVPPPTLLAR